MYRFRQDTIIGSKQLFVPLFVSYKKYANLFFKCYIYKNFILTSSINFAIQLLSYF